MYSSNAAAVSQSQSKWSCAIRKGNFTETTDVVSEMEALADMKVQIQLDTPEGIWLFS